MSDPVWPLSLPQRPLAEGFHERAADTLVRTQMEAGPAKVRRRFTAGVRTMDLQLRLTGSQVETLDGFHDSTLAGGALAFDWVHPRTDLAIRCRFAEPPSYAPYAAGRLWTATLKLEILP
jgi:hypothetical protein